VRENNVIQQKSYAFAVRIVKMCQHLADARKEFVLSKQVLRSGTSIGANVEEAIGAQSKADFMSKMSIAYKEARETVYWLRLLNDTDYLTKEQFNSMRVEADELCRILSRIQTTAKGHLRNGNRPAPDIRNS